MFSLLFTYYTCISAITKNDIVIISLLNDTCHYMHHQWLYYVQKMIHVRAIKRNTFKKE